MDKNYDPKQHEAKLYSLWESKGYFSAQPNSPKKPYGLLIPPPNVTGALHLGHAMEHSIMDALARFKRMQGFDVLLLPGVDHAGIQFEGTLNRALEKDGLTKQRLGREEWLKRAWAFKEKSYNSVAATWRMMGLSADWKREVFTLDEKVARAVFEEFRTFWEQDLLYKSAYIVQWCPRDQTAIEDVEMEYEEKKEKLYFVKFKIKGDSESIIVTTARPETIAADVAVAIYPNHPKYSKLVGQKAINPFTNSEMEIIEDERIDKEFGTGALKVTPGHSLLDYQIGKDHNFPVLHAIGKDGRITDLDPNLKGLKAGEARLKAAETLESLGQIEKSEEYIHSVPVCERCKFTIEPLISEEWFVRMTPLAQKALKKIKDINFVPENYRTILSDWTREIHDWCISRPLWWGHRIPVWYCQKCNERQQVAKDAKNVIVSRGEPKINCPNCSAKDWEQDEKLLDTWFSSGLWPIATLGWPNETLEFKKYYPWDFETSSGEIKSVAIARMIMLSVWFTDQIPFRDMLFHGMMRDLRGRKFSKSLGNGIDPIELINLWGTDATRMALYTYSAPGRDGRASKETLDERAKNYRNFANKLWNIARFILEPKEMPDVLTVGTSESSHPDDVWIKKELGKTIREVTKNLENFQLHLAIENIYEFTWHKFADIYLEKTKERREDAQEILIYVLEKILIILHPFMPFITEEIWQKSRASGSRRDKKHPVRDTYFSAQFLMSEKWPEIKS